MNDAPRRWWNKVDGVLRSLGGTPTRADRCCYVFYSSASTRTARQPPTYANPASSQVDTLETAMEYLTDPVAGSPSRGREIIGIICLHVDDLFCVGNDAFCKKVIGSIRGTLQVGSDDTNDVMFVGQRIRRESRQGQAKKGSSLSIWRRRLRNFTRSNSTSP